jgi:cobalt/nickel transport system permease protein
MLTAAMHIPDGFLSAGVAAGTFAGAAVAVAVALRAERRDPNPVPAGTLGAVAAFVFAAQMVNVPVAPGTSGHLVGATLCATVLGPWRSVLVMAVVLAIQAILFQDGGLSALGANLVDMGVAGSLAGYAVATLVGRWAASVRGYAIGAMLGAFAATIAAAALASLWLGLSRLYPLQGILPVMLVAHVAIGVLEAALTGAIIVTLLRWRPDLLRGLETGGAARRPGAVTLGVLGVAIAIAAFLAPLASSLPDGLERTAAALGFADRARAAWPAPLAGFDQTLSRTAGLTTAMAGVAGTIVVAAVAWIVSRSLRTSRHAAHR